MNLKLELFSDRIGPDFPLSHLLLFSKRLGRWLARKKLGKFGENAELRPYCTIVGGKNVEIGSNVVIRPFCQLHASIKGRIIIEDDVLIAPNVFITTNTHNYLDITRPIRLQGGEPKDIIIKSGAWIAAGAIILSGVTIGKNAVVAAGAVVTQDIADYCVVAGVPAKAIKNLAK